MCGINGIYSYDKSFQAQQIINGMNDCISHRGPDAEGSYHHQSVHLGHRRLAIIDLDNEANQPFYSKDKNVVLVFNGEIYNYRQIKEELTEYDFKTTSDTEVVLAAYQKWGRECFQKFNGMFAIAIYNKNTDEILIARDRLGIKPLYYYSDSERVIFSSEIKALLASGLIPKKADEKAIVDYLRYQTVHAPNTIIKGIKMLMPGQYMTVSEEGIAFGTYWKLAEDRADKFLISDEKSAQRQVKKLFFESVERRMISDVSLGAFLSGGIDSSAIVAAMSRFSNKAIKTFSVVFNEEEFSEAKYARLLAEKFKTEHHEINLKPHDLLDELENALQAMDHPTADGINTYVVSKATKNAGITVALSGLGGDELFAGYPIFRQLMELQGKKWLLSYPKLLRKIFGILATANKKDVSAQKKRQILMLDYFDLHYSYPISRQSFSKEQIVKMSNLDRLYKSRVSEIVEEQVSFGSEAFSVPYLGKVSISEISTYMQNILLRDSDNMSMAHALEVRVPFLDHKLVEFVLQVEDAFKLKSSAKALLTESLGDLIPNEIIDRPKMGFVFPWEHWLRTELKEFAEENLKNLANHQLFQEQSIMDIWKDFLNGKPGINWSRIWSLVVLSYWMRKHDVR